MKHGNMIFTVKILGIVVLVILLISVVLYEQSKYDATLTKIDNPRILSISDIDKISDDINEYNVISSSMFELYDSTYTLNRRVIYGNGEDILPELIDFPELIYIYDKYDSGYIIAKSSDYEQHVYFKWVYDINNNKLLAINYSVTPAVNTAIITNITIVVAIMILLSILSTVKSINDNK